MAKVEIPGAWDPARLSYAFDPAVTSADWDILIPAVTKSYLDNAIAANERGAKEGAITRRHINLCDGRPSSVGPAVPVDTDIDPSAQISSCVRIASGVKIGKGSVLGLGTIVMPNAVIGESVTLMGCTVGEASRIHDEVELRNRKIQARRVVTNENSMSMFDRIFHL